MRFSFVHCYILQVFTSKSKNLSVHKQGMKESQKTIEFLFTFEFYFSGVPFGFVWRLLLFLIFVAYLCQIHDNYLYYFDFAKKTQTCIFQMSTKFFRYATGQHVPCTYRSLSSTVCTMIHILEGDMKKFGLTCTRRDMQ